MDGINGITSLSVGTWGLTAFVVGSAESLPGLEIIGAVTAGAALGFLPRNAPVAKLFLGDVGSYLLGGLVAAGILLGAAQGAPVPILVAPLLLYVVDTGTVLAKRLARGDSIFEAHREHVYQRLTREARLPHIAVAAAVSAISVIITLVWTSGSYLVATLVTILLSAAYLASPVIWRHVRVTSP